MAYDEYLSERIDDILTEHKVNYYSKKMFGGLCYMVDDKMCLGIREDMIMARVDPGEENELRKIHGVKDMDFTGRSMKGFLYVESEAIDTYEQLAFFVGKCLEYNPKAKKSKKRQHKSS